MNEYYMNVSFEKGKIDTNLFKLVQNDYNSTKLNFTFDKEGTIQFKMLFPDKTTAYIDEIVNNEVVLGAGLLSQNGTYKIEICVNGTDSRLTDYPTHEFIVRKELINTDEIVEPDDRVPILDNLINEVNQAKEDVEDLKDDIDTALEEVNQAIEETNNLDLDANKVGKEATVEITKKDGTTKEVKIYDGVSLQFMWQGTSLGIKTDDMQDYVFVNLQGIQGVPGPQGEPFRIKKTYSSVAEMNADFDNMNVGDYVMIASTVEVEDNAKLYTRGDYQWIFITDFSGATGIKGETGATPIIHIGTVTSGDEPSVTISGTAENPIFNFVLKTGPQGEVGPQGQTGATGNGIASITKTSTSGLVDTYTITYTNGTTTTFQITNGEDGEVTQAQLDETNRAIDYYKSTLNALPKVEGEGTNLTLDDTAEAPMKMSLGANTEQATTTGKNLLDLNNRTEYSVVYNTPTNSKDFNGSKLTYPLSASGYINQAVGTITYSISNNIVTMKTPSTAYGIGFDIKLNQNTQYIVSLNKDSNGTAFISFYDENGIFIRYSQITGNSLTFTTPENATYTVLVLNGTTNTQLQFSNIMIRLASITDDTYEPYTGGIPAPNPEFPEKIHTISGDNEIKNENINLFDGEIELGYIDANGNKVSNNNYVRSKNLTRILPNNTYKFSSNGNNIAIVCAEYDKNNIFISLKTVASSTYYTSSENAYYILFRTYNTSTDLTQKIAINKGTTIQPYTPHQEQSLPLNLPVKNLFDISKITGFYNSSYTEPVSNVGTISNGIITVNRGLYATRIYLYDSSITLKAGTYTFSYIAKADKDTGDKKIQSRIVKKSDFSTISDLNKEITNYRQEEKFSQTFTLSEETEIILCLMGIGGPGDLSNLRIQFYNIQLEQGTKANSYTQFGTPALEYYKIGDYEDEFVYNTTDTSLELNKWYLKKNTASYTFTGNESFSISPSRTNENRFCVFTGNITPRPKISAREGEGYFNRGNVYSYASTNISNNFFAYNQNDYHFLAVATSAIPNWDASLTDNEKIELLKNYLATVNNTIKYLTNTTQYILLNDTLQSQLTEIYNWLVSYQYQTNISQVNNDLPFRIKVSAIRDMSKIFELIGGGE